MKSFIINLIIIVLCMSSGFNLTFSKSGEAYSKNPAKTKTVETKEEKHPIDLKVEKCIVEKCRYATTCMAGCINDSEKDWLKEIDQLLNKLRKGMTNEEYQTLAKSQQKWEEYAKAQKYLDEQTYGKMMGSMYIVVMASSRSEILSNRVKELNRLYNYFSDK